MILDHTPNLPNVRLTCNSGPKGLAHFLLSVATAKSVTTGIVRL